MTRYDPDMTTTRTLEEVFDDYFANRIPDLTGQVPNTKDLLYAAFREGWNAAWEQAWNAGFNDGFAQGHDDGFEVGVASEVAPGDQ